MPYVNSGLTQLLAAEAQFGEAIPNTTDPLELDIIATLASGIRQQFDLMLEQAATENIPPRLYQHCELNRFWLQYFTGDSFPPPQP